MPAIGEGEQDRWSRVERTEYYPKVGDATQNLKAVVPVFGETIVNAVIGALQTGQVRRGAIELVNLTDPPQKMRIVFERDDGEKDVGIQLIGDWNDTTEIPTGNPLLAPGDGKIYRKFRPEDDKPIVEEESFVEPDGAICIFMQGKGNIRPLRLPPLHYPRGGNLKKFVTPDGEVVQKNGIICYVEKIE